MKLKSLVISNLYPNSIFPLNGIFTEHRVRSLNESGNVVQQVLSPVPWFPWRTERFGRYADFARVPADEMRKGIKVRYPRFPVIPRIGMSVSSLLLALSLVRPMRRLIREGFDFDVIDAYYFYPDGVAAVLLGKWFHKPVVITAYGSDLCQIADYTLPRRQIRWAANHAGGVTTVCQALKEQLVRLGVEDRRVYVVLHGVDLDLFQPSPDRERLRAELNITGPTLLMVGHLIKLKGQHLVIEALRDLPGFSLLIAGQGEERDALQALAERSGVAERVRFLGALEQSDLSLYYSGADALVLASSREGVANVLLESMACGTPVVATNVWGTPEVVTVPEAGVLMEERSVAGVVAGVRRLFANLPERADTRRFIEQFTWARTAQEHLLVMSRALHQDRD